MTDIPENIDLQWIGRHLADFRRETRDRLGSIEDQITVLTGIAMRHDGALEGLAVEVRGLIRSLARLTERLSRLENAK